VNCDDFRPGPPSAAEQLLQLFGPAILDGNMTVVAREESPYFGDVAVTLRSAEFEIRLVSDRGTYFAEIRPYPGGDEWYDLTLLQMLVTGEDTLDGVPIQSQANFFRDHLIDVGKALAQDRWPLTRRQLEESERQRAAKRFEISSESPRGE